MSYDSPAVYTGHSYCHTPCQVMVQGVHDTYDTYRTRPWADRERDNTLVVIGRWGGAWGLGAS